MEHPMARLRVYALALAMTLAACVPGAGSQSATVMDEVAESYVRLVLAVGEHDTDYVDAYYGPQEWRDEVTAEQLGLSAIAARADALIERLRAVDAPDQGLERLRYTYLATQLGSLTARVDMLGGRTMTFDEESRALYDAVAPTNPGEYYASILEELDDVLPPGGSITERFGEFRSAYVIPPARLYIDGHVDADGAVDWLVRYAMYSPGGARQRLRFVDQYRSYVINYNLGLDLVRDYVDGDGTDGARAGATPDVRWDRFMRLLASPRLPGDL